MSQSSQLLTAAVALLVLALSVSAPAAEPSARQVEFFEAKIRPLLATHCYGCHSAGKPVKGSLRLDHRDGLLQGGDSGAAVVPGKPEQSLLIAAVEYRDDDYQMPPSGKLPQASIDLLRRWVAMGAPDPRVAAPVGAKPAAEPAAEPASHWAFQPLRQPPLPAVDSTWPRDPLDVHLLHRLQQAKIGPADDAAPATLARRLAYDLTGLPPSQAVVEEFLRQPDEQAYRRLVDRLLASPRFGERWCRYWLDLSRYADTKGYVFTADRTYPDAFRYRDWVIAALNSDRPYDEFLKYQIAADRLTTDPRELAALGFLTLGRRFLNNVHDIIDDRIDVVCRGTMALTVSCARCHDHKYDPIPTQDYYSLYGVFFSSEEPKKGASPLQLADKQRPVNVAVFRRGNPGNRGEPAPRRFLRALVDNPQPFANGSGRLELAEEIVRPSNPLTARVWVNRVWGRLFGSHLVSTPSDFGLRSDPPAQAEVLDCLAAGFVDNGWSSKQLIRRIVLSSAYRQSSRHRAAAADRDPENLLFWKMNRKRLDFEALRDSLLAAADAVNDTQIGGPSEKIEDPAARRRTLYAHVDRQNLPGVFRTFDFASPDTHNPQRPQTTVPQQALFLMNNPLVMDLARRLAGRTQGDPDQRLRTLFRTVLHREPDEHEQQLCRQLLHSGEQGGQPSQNRWAQLAQVLLLSNEALFLD